MTASRNLLFPFAKGDEEDALTRGRRFHRWRAGERKRIKNGYQRRVQQQKRNSILAELEAIRAEQERLTATIGEGARRSGAPPLALRASQAAAVLGVSESQLRQWVSEGKVHKPYRVRKNVVLFDAAELALDWERMKAEAMPSIEPEAELNNLWDFLL